MNENEIYDVIYQVIDDINSYRTTQEQISKSPNLALNNESGGLDSLGLINFITGLESKISDKFGKYVDLSNFELLQGDSSPFSSVSELVDYISTNVK